MSQFCEVFLWITLHFKLLSLAPISAAADNNYYNCFNIYKKWDCIDTRKIQVCTFESCFSAGWKPWKIAIALVC